MNKVRLAMVGCGMMGQSVHLQSFLKNPKCEVVAICDQDGELAGKVAKKINYDYKYAYTEPEAYDLYTKILDRAQVMHTMEPDGAMSFDIETSGLNWYKKIVVVLTL